MDGGVNHESLGLNRRAARIADSMVEDAAELRIAATRLDNGARVIDCGIEAAGGLEAGRRLAEVCMGGLGQVGFNALEFEGLRLPGLVVRTDHPATSCLGAQYAGWAIQPEGYFAMGSGPLRAIARVEKELFAELRYAETVDEPGVLVLETRAAPDTAVAEFVVSKSGVAAERLTFLVAPTASLAGGVQISARVVETGLHKLHALGFDVMRVQSGFGTAPIAPVAKNDVRAIGRTNDCMLYGGVAHFSVRADDDELTDLVPRVPSSASSDYGKPFYDIFQSYDGDFYKVDPHLFSPAEVFVTNLASGRTFHAGSTNAEVLRRSLLG